MYEKKTIFSPDQIQALRSLYNTLPVKKHARLHNLINVEKRDVPAAHHSILPLLCLQEAVVVENTVPNSYFLRYTAGSFACMHQDNPKEIKKTVITLIHRSDDIVGGDAVLMGRGKVSDTVILKFPVIPVQEVGSSLIYNNNVIHGVSKVESGERIVLVTWFRKQ